MLSHGAYKKAAAPSRKLVAAVDEHSARGDGWRPNPNGLLHAILFRYPFTDRTTGIFPAIRDYGPAIVRATFNQIQFVTPERPMLMFPKLARLFIEDQALGISMPVSPDLGECIFYPHKRIVVRNATVVMKT